MYETYQNFYLKIFIFGGKIFSIFEYGKHVFAMFLNKRMAIHVNHFLSYDDFFFFFFFFDWGFTALSRIFHLYRADRSSKVGENRRTRRKTT